MPAIYPVRVPRQTYAGRDSRRRQRVADHNRRCADLERYLNDRLAGEELGRVSYTYDEIARPVGLTTEEVSEALFPVDCGNNGLTVWKE